MNLYVFNSYVFYANIQPFSLRVITCYHPKSNLNDAINEKLFFLGQNKVSFVGQVIIER